jgi:hypothetical protein
LRQLTADFPGAYRLHRHTFPNGQKERRQEWMGTLTRSEGTTSCFRIPRPKNNLPAIIQDDFITQSIDFGRSLQLAQAIE